MRVIKLYKMDGFINHYKTWQEAFRAIKFGSHYSYDGELEANFYIDDKYFYYTPIGNMLVSVDEDMLDDLIDYYQDRNYIVDSKYEYTIY